MLVWQDQVHVLFETSKQPNGSQTGKYVRSTAFKVADQYVAEPRQHKEVESDGTQEATEVSTKKQRKQAPLPEDAPKTKECPRCLVSVRGHERILEIFGTRRIGRSVLPQSYCRKCRSKLDRESEEQKPKRKPERKAAKPAPAKKPARSVKAEKSSNVVWLKHNDGTTNRWRSYEIDEKAGRFPADPETKEALGGKWKFCTKCGVEQQEESGFRLRKVGEKTRRMAECISCEREGAKTQRRTKAEAQRARHDKNA